MHRSSEWIGAIAAALAKAQAELTNPEKSLTGIIPASTSQGQDRTFRYAPLSSGLDIVRKCLGRHEIAAMQTTAIDQSGLIRLTTVLAHSSGEWVSSDWPVCPVTETAEPHRMGAALTYARRYALFTLVGIAGEDDMDAPDLGAPAEPSQDLGVSRRRANGGGQAVRPSEMPARRKNPSALDTDFHPHEEQSAQLRDQLIAEIERIGSADEAAMWAQGKLGTKNKLIPADASAVEYAFAQRLSSLEESQNPGIAQHGDQPSGSELYPELRENPKTPLAKRRDPDSTERMIRPGFLDIESRQNLIELARDGSAAHRLARRANALVLLDDGMSCEAIAKVLLLDDDTIRTWYRLYEGDGIEGLTNFSYEGSACQLSGEQQEKLKAWVATALPRTTRQVGAWIENEFGVVYEGRSGLIALLHRLGLEYHKPNVIPRKLDEEKQKAFIEGYEKLLNSLGDDEAVLFADAVHPTHAARPVGCWAPSREKLAIEQTSGRQRINIHGAIDLETGQTRMIEALTIDAASTIRLLQSIEALYPMLALIHVFLDNARYHHAKLVQEWLALPGRRIKLHFIPTYCPHLNPIERLWGLMHRNVTHNKCYATCAQFADATLSFLREKVPGNWADLCDSVTDNFRIINPKDFRVMT